MPTYIDRYLAGERVAVRKELMALGKAVRRKPVQADANAVADETMRRARQNIEVLIPRLCGVGYRFAAPGRIVADTETGQKGIRRDQSSLVAHCARLPRKYIM